MNSPFLQFFRVHLNYYLKKLSFGEFSINFYILCSIFTKFFCFLKNKKILSHHAKAYRGEVLRQIANAKVTNKDELMALNFENLKLVDMKKIGLKNELTFEICE